jgi:Hint domain
VLNTPPNPASDVRPEGEPSLAGVTGKPLFCFFLIDLVGHNSLSHEDWHMRAAERLGRMSELNGFAGGQGDRAAVAALPVVPRATPCFTPGTLIATQRGELPVEHLKVGDLVVTRDNGMKPIRWLGKTQMFLHDFQADPHLLPVFIRQGALGKGLPESDMMVSPNHRILVTNERTALRFREREVLVAAKHLSSPGVYTIQSSGTTYIHFMCDKHEIILANGVWTESFHPDDVSLKGIGNAQRLEILEIFPDLKTAGGREAYGRARSVISGNPSALAAEI